MEWRNLYRGLIMGASDMIPGVSGGTIAVLLGIYDQLIEAINGLFSKRWYQQLSFLLPLAIGVAVSIFSLARVMNWLLAEHPSLTYYFFLGLIIGIIPHLFQEAEATRTFKALHIFLLFFGILAISSMRIFLGMDEGMIISDRSLSTYFLLFISGFFASAAMILPGISGSVVFLILGVYPTVIHIVSKLEFGAILIVSIGIALGIITMSKIIHYFLSHFKTATFALIIGAVIGSVFVIFPGWPENLSTLLANISTFAFGLFVAYILGKVEYEPSN